MGQLLESRAQNCHVFEVNSILKFKELSSFDWKESEFISHEVSYEKKDGFSMGYPTGMNVSR